MLLTDTRLKHIKPEAKDLNLSDGRGSQLYCRVKPNGLKTFIFRYSYHGRASNTSLGKYPSMTLKTARAKAAECKAMLANGINPAAHKAKQQQANQMTFAHVVNEWFSVKAQNYAQPYKKQVLSKINRLINPIFGNIRIDAIETRVVIAFLRKFEAKGHLAQRDKIKAILSQIFGFTVASGLCKFNPVTGISTALKAYKAKHLAFVKKSDDIHQLLNSIDQYSGNYTTVMALKLAPLVLLRPSELSQLEWSEVDIVKQQLTIKAERMKMRRQHVVPLSTQALAIIEAIQQYSGDGKYVFPSSRDASKAINISTLRLALRSMGYDDISKPKHDTHGFRHMGSTKLYELSAQYRISGEVIEKQLAHEESNKVKATYNHAEYLPERQRMMQLWSDYLDNIKAGDNVIPMVKQG
jgi:integrase